MENTNSETDQLIAWRGEFGNTYTGRNLPRQQEIVARTKMWARILSAMEGNSPRSILEIGANIGNNLRAISRISDAELFALEPNERARASLAGDNVAAPQNILGGSAASIDLTDDSIDLVFTSGVLIHIHPDDLLAACREIDRVAHRYIMCAEYFSVRPERIAYRGRNDLLYKRDFGGFWLEQFPVRVVDYGFFWKPMSGIDNLTWWLFEKNGTR